MIESIKHIGQISFDIAWAGVILLAPITSFPLLSRLAGGSLVAPASFIPLCWLMFFWFLFYLLKKGIFPRESIPFLLFVSIAIIASAFAFFIYIPSYKGIGNVGEEGIAVLTLFIGAAFYLVTSAWLFIFPGKLAMTLKMITIGGLIMLIWALCQGIVIYFFHSNYPSVFYQFQALFSFHGFNADRMVGFAYEPSWLGQALNLFYLPFWLAETLTGHSSFSFRVWKLSIENVLMAVGAIVLFSCSRVGTLSLLLILAFLVVYLNIHLGKKIRILTSKHTSSLSPILQKTLRALLPFGILVGFLGIYTLSTVALVYVLSHVDPRYAKIFTITSLGRFKGVTTNIYRLFNFLQFAERYVYWVAGWNIFNTHPFIGVGLGNAGFFFPSTLPSYGWRLPEVRNILYHFSFIPNIKSLWVRLLAETGILGFAAFVTWYYVLLRSGWLLRLSTSRLNKTIGWFGFFVLIGLIIEGFSTDTFALPYFWVSMGILSAVAASTRWKT